MNDELTKLKNDFLEALKQVKNSNDLEQVEIQFLGRKAGALTQYLRAIQNLSESERPRAGEAANALKKEIIVALEEKRMSFEGQRDSKKTLDATLPGIPQPEGHLHVVTQAKEEITAIFERVGFYRVQTPEVEWDYYAFESLNMPQDHPARDEWETFFIKGEQGKIFQGPKKYGRMVLTPHTSSVQVREMEKGELPIRVMCISKCYRRQIDVSHVPMFHQFEGLLIDKGVALTHLIGVLQYFVKEFFGAKRLVRVRPFHFQFTEPSFEVDVSCGVCRGSGCRLCKQGWLELGGAGMVHPNVLKAGGIDPKTYSGFAFGWGVERCFMMKEGLELPDIRILYQNDLRFLEQF